MAVFDPPWLPEFLQAWSAHERMNDIMLDCSSVNPCSIEAQPALLAELLSILVDNACKYSPPGTPIALRLRREEQAVCVDVDDKGDGIAEADLPHLFQPFFRSAQARRLGVEGFGLGLAIAKRLAAAFGGELTVTSRAGHGSCFTLRLPAR